MTSSARIILDSVGPNGSRLTTFELTYPRMVHAELMTHRLLSRNSASSRAIPVKRMIERVVDDPAMPVFWGRANPGMQSNAELDEPILSEIKRDWLQLRDIVVGCVKLFGTMGLHKQLANRPLETWMDITVIATATHWSNMRALRVHPAAQPEIADVMRKAFELYDTSEPQELAHGQWHLPFVTGYDEEVLRPIVDGFTWFHDRAGYSDEDLCMISSGRCAAVSYLNHDTGKSEPDKDVERSKKILSSGHMSPFEHVAQAMTRDQWLTYGRVQATKWVTEGVPVGNLWGWRQYRKTIEHEHDFSLFAK